MDITKIEINLNHLYPKKTEIYCIMIDNVFSEQECLDFISMSENKGYEKALVGYNQHLNEDFRKSYRCMIDSEEIASNIFTRIKHFIPKKWLNCDIIGLNERLRFLKYEPGNFFGSHHDGSFERTINDQKQASFITVQIYLNDVEEENGGHTTFLNNEETKRVCIRPKRGSVLLFEHRLLHEGSLLTDGLKYVIRTDVMYDSKNFTNKFVRPRWSM